MPWKKLPPIERFDSLISPEPNSGCWLWLGQERLRYGRIWNGYRLVAAHRWAYEHFVGPIPEGLHIDHKCFVSLCVNPDHLQPLTQAENNRRSFRAGRRPTPNMGKTHCKRGHAFDEKNTYFDGKGYRSCNECRRIRARQRYADKRANA